MSLRKFVSSLSNSEMKAAVLSMAERLIELEELCYVLEDIDVDEDLRWTASGESVIDNS